MANGLFGATFAVLPEFANARGAAGMYGLLLTNVAAGVLADAALANRLTQLPYGRFSVGTFGFGAVAWTTVVASP